GNGRGRARKEKRAPSKAKIKIASLNMKGFGTPNREEASNKWMLVNQVIREKKIAIMALQETHLDRKRAEAIEEIFGRHVKVLYSGDTQNETGARGVAFAINLRIMKEATPQIKEVIPGRAAILEIEWSCERTLRILNVYGPNATTENAAFWDTLKNKNLGRMDIMMGDFNIVEEAVDRLPPRRDRETAVSAMRSLKTKMGMHDGWRDRNPAKVAFTFCQPGGTAQSRLDRIYIKEAIRRETNEWEITESGIPTDHRMVAVEIENYKAPYVGRGRWAMPTHLLNDEKMRKEMKEIGGRLIKKLEAITVRTERNNPQSVYADFKKELITAARQRAKEKIPKIQKRIHALREDLDKTLNPQLASENIERENEAKLQRAAFIQHEITRLEKKRFETARREVATRHWAKAETMTRYWTKNNV
ncbi:Endonuclease/exonuclease/phosphatase, partial [Trametes maxima]